MLEGRYAPQALSLLRIAASLIFLLHGSSKLLGFPASEMGMPPVGSLMWIGGVLELVGGLLSLQLATRSLALANQCADQIAVGLHILHDLGLNLQRLPVAVER